MKILPKLIKFCKLYQQDVVLVIAIFLITLISFNAGRIYGTTNLKNSLKITGNDESAQNLPSNNENTKSAVDLRVVASKNSTSQKYHFLWCPGAQKINESNKIYFSSEIEARGRGYTLAGNCTK